MREISVRTVIRRINRKLAHDEQRLCVTRGERARSGLGDYYILDWRRNVIVDAKCTPLDVAQRVGCIAADERIAA